MEHSCIQLDDLPDEILLIILKKLHNSDVLYSLIGVNKRLDTIASDSIFTKNLTLISHVNKRFRTIVNNSIFTRNLTLTTPSHGLSHQFTDTILARFCRQILPSINNQIERLDVESSLMERILLATNYPNLHTLGLYDLAPKTACDLFSNRGYLIDRYQNQISELFINMKQGALRRTCFVGVININISIFIQICIKFKNLEYLNFSSSSYNEQLTFANMPSTKFSSNLLELHVVVQNVQDCLYLLDDHFNQLHTFYVTICSGSFKRSPVNNQKKLPSLKCFSLICEHDLGLYDEIYVPLLERMSNLEELSLCFIILYDYSIIDGDHLTKNITNRMTRLNKFTFNICSSIRLNNEVNLPSNEDIRNTFRNFPNSYQIISYVDYFAKSSSFRCHIYSYPYSWSFYYNITLSFPGGLSTSVREISLYDERPFEYEFFLQISQSFPFVEKLTLNNLEPQENDNQQCSIIKYPYLTKLDLIKAHENYVEQFLNDTKTCLVNDIYLRVPYNLLEKVTDNFTKDETRINCLKIIGLVLDCALEVGNLKDYFPRAEIYGLFKKI